MNENVDYIKFNFNDVKTRGNHFVPQAYLNVFSANDNEQIWMLDKHKKAKPLKTKILNVCKQRDLYVINKEDLDLLFSWEDYYRVLMDNEIENVISETIKNEQLIPVVKPLFNIKFKLAIMVSCQMIRIPSRIFQSKKSYLEDLNILFTKEISKMTDNIEYINALRKNLESEPVFKQFALSTLNKNSFITKICNTLLNKTWLLFCNYTDIDFITSDNPVVIYNYHTKNVGIDNGIINSNTLIAYPIHPRYMVVIFPNEYLLGGLKLFYEDSKIDVHEEKVVRFYNNLQFENCTRQIFASREEDLL